MIFLRMNFYTPLLVDIKDYTVSMLIGALLLSFIRLTRHFTCVFCRFMLSYIN